MLQQEKLYYIHDPMCSWCWGFKPTLEKLEKKLTDTVSVQYVLGGLAKDSDQAMPEEMQSFLRQTWLNIQNTIPNTAFNFDFWSQCKPRRSTYPACRAVIAAKKQNMNIEKDMIVSIQKAYYLNAKNPSNDQTLINLANDLKLDVSQFATDIKSNEIQEDLMREIQLSRKLGAQGFPSLVFENRKGYHLIDLDYHRAETMLEQIKELQHKLS